VAANNSAILSTFSNAFDFAVISMGLTVYCLTFICLSFCNWPIMLDDSSASILPNTEKNLRKSKKQSEYPETSTGD
jgi:hypothetical protein